MKKNSIIIMAMSIGSLHILFAQALDIGWQKSIGGKSDEHLHSIQQTSDGGYIIGGDSNSGISGDKTEASKGSYDYWVVKLNATGTRIWQNTIGGSNSDQLYSIQQTKDGGYILGGNSTSGISGDKTEASQGYWDYWVVKLDSTGQIIEWQNTIGGDVSDNFRSIQQTEDGGYILGGNSTSEISGDKTEASQGYWDCWVVKLDSTGQTIEWQNTIGGDGSDNMFSIQTTADGGYVLGGNSESEISGDKTMASQGYWDYWVVKLDSTGQTIEWQNTIGSDGNDNLYSIQQTEDGGYILGGNSFSGISGDKLEGNLGWYDFWAVKLDSTGQTIEWQNTIGGSGNDNLYSIQTTAEGGYILGGNSESGMSGYKTVENIGWYDYWAVILDSTGQTIEWQNTFGGTRDDNLFSIQQTPDGGYILGGDSDSGMLGNKTEASHGSSDYWLVKLNGDKPLTVEIYDISGKLISKRINTAQNQGLQSVIWNGTNQYNVNATAGLYLCKITLGEEVKTTKLILLK
jgi:flagellar hook assembly protein FlgD